MNKNILLFLGGTVLLVIAAISGYWYLQPRAPQSGTPTSENSSGSDSQTLSMSFQDLLALGQNYTCTFDTTDDNGNTTNGTVYVADHGNKLKGDFTLQQPNQDPTSNHIIRDGEYSYFWLSTQQQGYKFTLTAEESNQLFPTQGDTGTESANQNFNTTQPVNFHCQPWQVDDSLFVPPSDITFTDLSAQMENMKQFLNDAKSSSPAPAMEESSSTDTSATSSDQCGVCDQVPAGDARTQCRQALGC